MGQQSGGVVVDLGRLDHDAHLAPRLDGVAFLDALLGLGDALQGLEAFDVVLQRLAPGAGTCRRHGVRRLYEDGLNGLRLHVAVVCADGVAHTLRLAVLAGQLLADLRVRPVDLVVDGLADVVQQTGTAGHLGVRAELGRHDTGEMGYFDGVVQHVLSVACAELQTAESAHQLGGQTMDICVEAGLLSGLLDDGLDLGFGLSVGLLDAGRMDAAVGDELGQGETRDLSAHTVEPAQDDRLGGVVDDEIDAGDTLEGTDVAALAADDSALHVVRRQGDDRHGRLGHVVGRRALDGQRQDVARAAIGLSPRVLFDRTDHASHLVACFLFCLLEKHLLGLSGAQTGDALQCSQLLGVDLFELVLQLGRVSLTVAHGLVAPVELQSARLDELFPLRDALFRLDELCPPLAHL